MIKVYQAIDPTFFVDSHEIVLTDFHLVAEVEGTDRETAYERTNSIQGPWWKNKGVTFLGSPNHGMEGCRSTSVGDVMELDGSFSIVASCGFEPVTIKEAK